VVKRYYHMIWLSSVKSTLVLFWEFSFSWLWKTYRLGHKIGCILHKIHLYCTVVQDFIYDCVACLVFMVMMSLQALVQWSFVGDNITYILYWNWLWVAIGLDYIIAWIFDMLELFTSYRRVYISNTDTHTHTRPIIISMYIYYALTAVYALSLACER